MDVDMDVKRVINVLLMVYVALMRPHVAAPQDPPVALVDNVQLNVHLWTVPAQDTHVQGRGIVVPPPRIVLMMSFVRRDCISVMMVVHVQSVKRHV